MIIRETSVNPEDHYNHQHHHHHHHATCCSVETDTEMYLISLLNGNEAGELCHNGEAGTQLNDGILSILLHNLTWSNRSQQNIEWAKNDQPQIFLNSIEFLNTENTLAQCFSIIFIGMEPFGAFRLLAEPT